MKQLESQSLLNIKKDIFYLKYEGQINPYNERSLVPIMHELTINYYNTFFNNFIIT